MTDTAPATDPPGDQEAQIARGLFAEDALLLATAGLGVVAGLRACAGKGGAVVVQRGHAIDVNGSMLDLIALAGARLVEIGRVDRCGATALAAGLTDAAVALFVADPAAEREGLLRLPDFLWAAHRAGRPVLVHHRRPPPWTWMLDAGADLVSVDLGPSLHRPGSLLLGKAELVAAVRAQRADTPMLLAPPDDLAGALLHRLAT